MHTQDSVNNSACQAPGIVPGKWPRGSRSHASKITEADVRKIRRLFARGKTKVEIGGQFGITPQAVGYIITGKTWKHVR